MVYLLVRLVSLFDTNFLRAERGLMYDEINVGTVA